MKNCSKIKELFLFKRDNFGNFIPKKVKLFDISLKESDSEIYIIPLVRGELLRYFAGFDFDNNIWTEVEDWIILEKIIYPRFTKNDINTLKKSEQRKYVNTVLYNSGVTFKKDKTHEKLDDFALRLKEIKDTKREAKFVYFLHERGYYLTGTNNNLNNLCNAEIDMLVAEFNRLNPPNKGVKNKTK